MSHFSSPSHPLYIIVAIFKKSLARNHRAPAKARGRSMRTSKNRSSRARYTCAGWGYRSVGSGRCSPVFHLSLLLCFARSSPATFLFSLPGLSRSHSPFLPVAVSLSFLRRAARSHSPRVVVRLFYYFYKCRRHGCYYHHHHLVADRRAFPLLVHHAPLLLVERCEF